MSTLAEDFESLAFALPTGDVSLVKIKEFHVTPCSYDVVVHTEKGDQAIGLQLDHEAALLLKFCILNRAALAAELRKAAV